MATETTAGTATAETPLVNIFKIGNVLDPHIRIEGWCAACDGTGEGGCLGEECFDCDDCGGTGRTAANMRLSELLPLMGPLAQFVGAEGAERGYSALPPSFTRVRCWQDGEMVSERVLKPGEILRTD